MPNKYGWHYERQSRRIGKSIHEALLPLRMTPESRMSVTIAPIDFRPRRANANALGCSVRIESDDDAEFTSTFLERHKQSPMLVQQRTPSPLIFPRVHVPQQGCRKATSVPLVIIGIAPIIGEGSSGKVCKHPSCQPLFDRDIFSKRDIFGLGDVRQGSLNGWCDNHNISDCIGVYIRHDTLPT